MVKNSQVLITGINGFIGKFLTEKLLVKGARVTGLGRALSCKHSFFREIEYVKRDLEKKEEIEQTFSIKEWDYIIHLSGENSVLSNWDRLLKGNVLATSHLFEEVIKNNYKPQKILVMGTAYEYDTENVEGSLNEEHPIGPNSNYGWSKHLQVKTAQWFGVQYKLPVIIARAFNLVGPSVNKGVCAQLIQQIVHIKNKKQTPIIYTGNRHVARDYLDVRDAAEAIASLLIVPSTHSSEVFNICSGRVFSIDQIIEMLREISQVEFKVEIDPEKVRANESVLIQGDNTKLVQKTNWGLCYSMNDTLRDLYKYVESLDKGGLS